PAEPAISSGCSIRLCPRTSVSSACGDYCLNTSLTQHEPLGISDASRLKSSYVSPCALTECAINHQSHLRVGSRWTSLSAWQGKGCESSHKTRLADTASTWLSRARSLGSKWNAMAIAGTASISMRQTSNDNGSSNAQDGTSLGSEDRPTTRIPTRQ